MPNYSFSESLSPIDFEILSKDLLEEELGIKFENFCEGRDAGIDLRHAATKGASSIVVQCKRYKENLYSNLKSDLKNKELPKIQKLAPERYILTTSVPLTPGQADEIKSILKPFILSTGDIYGKDRLNALLRKFPEVEKGHNKLWLDSTNVLEAILNAGIHAVSREEIERTISAGKLYVKNPSFDDAMVILNEQKVCIISGIPGIGKTTLARMLLLDFYRSGFELIKIESDISEARDVAYHKKPRFYYYDDFLGQTVFADKLNKNEDQKILDFMRSVHESEKSVMILTTREYVLNQAKLCYEKFDREHFDHQTCIVDLSKYSRRIRAQILYNHLHFSNLSEGYVEALIDGNGIIEIVDHPNYSPRLIEMLTSTKWIGSITPEKYTEEFIANLDNPTKIWSHAFENQLSNEARHALLVLTTFPSEVEIDDFRIGFDSFHQAMSASYGMARRPNDFERALKELDGTFLEIRSVHQGTIVEFQNPSIRDFLVNLLLQCHLLSNLLQSLVYYEQAEWFVDILADPESPLILKKLKLLEIQLVDRLIYLYPAKGRSVLDGVRNGTTEWVSKAKFDPAGRLTRICQAVVESGHEPCDHFVENELLVLAQKILSGGVGVECCVEALGNLATHDLLSSAGGRTFVNSIREKILQGLDEVEDFEQIVKLQQAVPESLSSAQFSNVGERLEFYAAGIKEDIANCGIDDPEELRELAQSFEYLEKWLKVDLDYAANDIREYAGKLELQQEASRDWEPDDDGRRGGGSPIDYFSNSDITSMFNTLIE